MTVTAIRQCPRCGRYTRIVIEVHGTWEYWRCLACGGTAQYRVK
jgi:NAD-dependent SIR2 family protein deacetylase